MFKFRRKNCLLVEVVSHIKEGDHLRTGETVFIKIEFYVTNLSWLAQNK